MDKSEINGGKNSGVQVRMIKLPYGNRMITEVPRKVREIRTYM